jgi:hypothetical protein
MFLSRPLSPSLFLSPVSLPYSIFPLLFLINFFCQQKTTIAQLFDKEARREKNLENAAREAKARKQPVQAQAQAQGTQSTPAQPAQAAQQAQIPHLNTAADVDALLGEVEKEFFEAMNVQEANGKPQ